MSTKEKIVQFSQENDTKFPENLSLDIAGCCILLDNFYELVELNGGISKAKQGSVMLRIAKELGISQNVIDNTTSIYPALVIIYEKYLKEFHTWNISQPNIRKSSRLKQTQFNDKNYISSNLIDLCEQKARLVGMNSIYSSLASGYPNEIDLTLNVLLELTLNQEYIQVLAKMESLYILLPAVVGVFTNNNGLFNHLSYLKNIPEIDQYLKYFLKHTVNHDTPLNTLSGSTDDDLRGEKETAKQFRVNQILTIILNLSEEQLNLTCDSPILGLLITCINTDILVISNKAYEIIVNLSKTISFIDHECPQIIQLLKSFEKTLQGRNRKQIINVLKSIINLCVSEKEISSFIPFNSFDVAILIELLSVLDYEIIVHSLLALQVLTIKIPFRPPTSKLITFIHSIILFISRNDMGDILSEDLLNHLKSHKLEIKAVDKKAVKDWFEHNFVQSNDLSKYVRLYDVYTLLRENFENDSHIKIYFLVLLKMFNKYTPLLHDTLELFFVLKNLNNVNSLLSSSTHFFIPFEFKISRACPPFNNFVDPTLKNLQLYRLKRESGSNHNLGWFIFNDKQNVNNETEARENTDFIEINDTEFVPTGTKKLDILKHTIVAANVLANLCNLNSSIKRYVRESVLMETMIEDNFQNCSVLNVLKKIVT